MEIEFSLESSITVYFLLLFVQKLLIIEESMQMIYSITGLVFSILILTITIVMHVKKVDGQIREKISFVQGVLFILLLSYDDSILSEEQRIGIYERLQYFLLGLFFRKYSQCEERESSDKKLIEKLIFVILTWFSFNFGQFSKQNFMFPQFLCCQTIIPMFGVSIFRKIYLYRKKQETLKENNSVQFLSQDNKYINGNIQNQGLSGYVQNSPKSLIILKEELISPTNVQDGKQEIQKNLKKKDDIIEMKTPPAYKNMNQEHQFYRFLFNQFPEGMIVIGEDKKQLYFMNQCVSKIFETKSKYKSVEKLMSLENCYKELKEEAQYQQLFELLDQRLEQSIKKNSCKYISHMEIPEESKSVYDDFSDSIILEPQNVFEEDQFNFALHNSISQSQTVKEEYKKCMQNAQRLLEAQTHKTIQITSQIQIKYSLAPPSQPKFDNSIYAESMKSVNSNIKSDKIKFLYETKLICRLGNKISFESFPQVPPQNPQNDQNNQEENQNKPNLLEITLKPYIFDAKPYVLILIRDVTLFNQFTVLKHINENKSKMLSQVAHEFRTPLNCIILLSEHLIEQDKKSQQITQDYYQPILTSANQLLSLTNDLLDIAQLKAGKFKIAYTQFDIRDLINYIKQILEPQAVSKNLYFNIIFDSNVPKTIVSDPNRISNALKFTSTGGITLHVQMIEQYYLKISLQDTGIGIEQSSQSKLFQAFGKLEESSDMNTQGVGLGLMISHIMAQKLSLKKSNTQTQQNLPELQQGLKVYSKGSGQGTTFSFCVFDQSSADYNTNRTRTISQFRQPNDSIYSKAANYKQSSINEKKCFIQSTQISKFQSPSMPFIKGEEEKDFSPQGLEIQQLSIDDLESSKLQFSPCKCPEILVIDDDAFNIKALKTSLKEYNPKIKEAYGYQDAQIILDQIKQQKCCQWIKIIIMDLEMPVNDGFETTILIRNIEKETIQQNPQIQPSYIIGCSGHGDEMKQKCLESGMNDFINKPIRKLVLLKIIQSQISKCKITDN